MVTFTFHTETAFEHDIYLLTLQINYKYSKRQGTRDNVSYKSGQVHGDGYKVN